MLTCEQSQRLFSPHLDGGLSPEERGALGSHLAACPVCRARLEETRSIVRGLSLVARPAPPPDLAASIKRALVIERAALAESPRLSFGERLRQWIEPRLMPYTAAAFYTSLLCLVIFGVLRQQMVILRNLAEIERLEAGLHGDAVWVGGRPVYDVTRSLAPDISAARAPFGAESPTINPRGALAALTYSPSDGDPNDDDMIVVADVYGNGSASLAEVVEPPRNPRALRELEDALRKGPAFVPATLDRRPQTMRVVFVLQKMNVDESKPQESF
ncbi:MAG TPA: zf-HC2 domain-containing protein [Pyrinomonadaceae bacterium]|nr:zf-HC2 domain-containing protein [Pyrinomonadaceae bacterium]